jgi:hypothetical protein
MLGYPEERSDAAVLGIVVREWPGVGIANGPQPLHTHAGSISMRSATLASQEFTGIAQLPSAITQELICNLGQNLDAPSVVKSQCERKRLSDTERPAKPLERYLVAPWAQHRSAPLSDANCCYALNDWIETMPYGALKNSLFSDI